MTYVSKLGIPLCDDVEQGMFHLQEQEERLNLQAIKNVLCSTECSQDSQLV